MGKGRPALDSPEAWPELYIFSINLSTIFARSTRTKGLPSEKSETSTLAVSNLLHWWYTTSRGCLPPSTSRWETPVPALFLTAFQVLATSSHYSAGRITLQLSTRTPTDAGQSRWPRPPHLPNFLPQSVPTQVSCRASAQVPSFCIRMATCERFDGCIMRNDKASISLHRTTYLPEAMVAKCYGPN